MEDEGLQIKVCLNYDHVGGEGKLGGATVVVELFTRIVN